MEDLENDLMKAIMMIKRTTMRLEVAIGTRGETISIISMGIIIEIREEEEEDRYINWFCVQSSVLRTPQLCGR